MAASWGIKTPARREGRLAAWLKSQTTEDLIEGARAMKVNADLRVDMLAELVLRGKIIDLNSAALGVS